MQPSNSIFSLVAVSEDQLESQLVLPTFEVHTFYGEAVKALVRSSNFAFTLPYSFDFNPSDFIF